MIQRTWEERSDWLEGDDRRTLEMEEVGEDEEKPRQEKDDWGGTEMGGDSWRQSRGKLPPLGFSLPALNDCTSR